MRVRETTEGKQKERKTRKRTYPKGKAIKRSSNNKGKVKHNRSSDSQEITSLPRKRL